jgi:hypothetical protein
MLDIPAYRSAESLALADVPKWLLAQRHSLDVFNMVSFPVRLDCLAQTRQLMDSMHENRFDRFMAELGGLAPAELEIFLAACRDAVDFQRMHYPGKPPLVPFNNLLATYAIFKKIRGLRPDFGNLLEIGPGCGYLALFLKQHAALQNYVFSDACESYYLLQHHVNRFTFGGRFLQGLLAALPTANLYVAESDPFLAGVRHLDAGPAPLARQYPWWRLGDIAGLGVRFDVVTANANLLEFSPFALADYLSLFRRVLVEDGIFFMQCIGSSKGGRTLPYLWETLERHGFAPLFFAAEHALKDAAAWVPEAGRMPAFLRAAVGDSRKFVLANAVFVAEGHPLFDAARASRGQGNCLLEHEPLGVFFNREPEAKAYDVAELMELLAAGPGPAGR